MEGKPPLALWFSHTGIIAYPPHCIQYLFSTPNTPLYSEIQDIFILKSTIKEGNFTAGVRAWFLIPVEKIQEYEIVAMNAYFDYPSNIACTGVYERTNDIAVAYQCFSSCSATCAVTMLFIKKDIINH